MRNGPQVITNGLTVALDAADKISYAGSGTTWDDALGAMNVTLNNTPTFTTDKQGGITLNGVNNCLIGNRPASIDFTNTYTIEVWMKLVAGDSIGGGAHVIGNNNRVDGLIRGGNGFSTQLTIDGSKNLRVFTFDGGGGFTNYNTGFSVSVGEICQVGLIHNSATNKAGFKNGALSAFESRWSTQNFSYVVIGGEHNEASYFTQMNYPNITVYAVRIYNRALSSAEVTHNFNTLRGRFGI